MADEKTWKELQVENAKLKLENETVLIALTAGVSVPALPDIVNRVQAEFDYLGGELTALGEHKTVSAVVAALKKDPEASHLFEGSSGAGASPEAKLPTPQPDTRKRSEMSLDQQADYIHTHGGKKYFALPE